MLNCWEGIIFSATGDKMVFVIGKYGLTVLGIGSDIVVQNKKEKVKKNRIILDQ